MNDIMAIIVLYNEELYNSNSFKTLLQSVNFAKMTNIHLFVYDNSPQPQIIPENNHSPFIIHYKSDITNGGISKAYNCGADVAKKLGTIQWLLFLDQDTNLPENLFVQYKSNISAHQNIHMFVPILMLQNGVVFSPCRYLFKRGFPLKKIAPGIHSFKNYSPVNSGMLVQLKAFFDSGGYKELVRLDFSDFQFVERFRKKSNFFVVIDAVCIQQFSNEETSVEKLNKRYRFFCEGAKYADRNNWLDAVMYFGVAFMRATTLFMRTKKTVFYKTFLQQYLNI